VGLNALKSLNLTNVYPNNNKNNNKKNNNNKIKSKPLELFELAGKNLGLSGIIDNSTTITYVAFINCVALNGLSSTKIDVVYL
jgi:hypothetical protein